MNGFQGDISIVDGKIEDWGKSLPSNENDIFIDAQNACCSPGWLDLKVRVGAPGNPQHESLTSLFKAASAGGFTRILISPETNPVIQNPESVHYFKNLENAEGIQVLVSAAASLNLEGKKMTEMLRLSEEGASAFSFVHPVADSRFLTQVLRYNQHTGKAIIHFPHEPTLLQNGQIHEGTVSDSRGLTGIPAIAETISLQRDFSILKYAGGKLHFSTLSVGSSPDLVALAKADGLEITCDLAAHQLAFTEKNLDQFETNFKVMPPFRTENDRAGLVRAVLAGKVDAIVSDHNPWHYDVKVCEFDLARFGISSLETTYSCLQTFATGINPELVVQLLANGPRKILGLEISQLEKGKPADFTLFHPEKEWTVLEENWQSKSKNTPFLGQNLKGLVMGIVTQKGFFQNPHF